MARSAVIIALVLQHLPCQLLLKLDLGRRCPGTRACLCVIGIHLRQADEESKLPVLPTIGPPSFAQAYGIVPPVVVVVHPMFCAIVARVGLGVEEGLTLAAEESERSVVGDVIDESMGTHKFSHILTYPPSGSECEIHFPTSSM